MEPGLSVVMPAYNSEKTIGRAIESVFAQKNADFELIVIDDGSTDGTPGEVKKYKKHVKCARQKNQGVAAARNLGIRLSSREFIAFLDSDDEWLPGKLARQFELFREHPEVGLTGTGVHCLDSQGRRIRTYGVQKTGSVLFPLMAANFITTSSVVLRKGILGGLKGPFRKGYAYGEDYLLWIELSLRCPFCITPEAWVNYSEPSDTQFSNKYSRSDILKLYTRIESIVKGRCGSIEIRKLRAKMHLELAELNRRLGNHGKMMEESLESFKSYPWIPINQRQIARNFFRYLGSRVIHG
jgi:glycosyltransferase involved in cell wall biosynthesis